MSAATDYTESLALNWLLTTNSATRPTTWYIGLFTTATTDAGGGTEVSTSGTAYARQTIAFSITQSSGTTKAGNSSTITFPTATLDWGTVTHMAVFTAATGGTMLFHGPLVTARTITSGDAFQISTGNFTIELQ